MQVDFRDVVAFFETGGAQPKFDSPPSGFPYTVSDKNLETNDTSLLKALILELLWCQNLALPKLSMISYAQLWLLLFLQIILFIYFNLGP